MADAGLLVESDEGVAGNERLTALTGAVLFVLLGLIGITVLRVRALLPQHLFLGFVLIPPLAVKIASTGYRFARYYLGDPAYRRAGPPQLFLRLLAPLVVLSTIGVFVTGLELWFFGLRFGSEWVALHKVTFLIWLPVTAIHVLAYLGKSTAAVGHEFSTPSGDALGRRSLVIGSLIAGLALALGSLLYASPFLFFGGDRG
ncbi:MAG TPA: hypothetical protein VFB69_00500 [Candidatus Dormibacteraeota bacterium]|nr:hypothetical protein [Candidatus Dormibacteraeota bacterium]